MVKITISENEAGQRLDRFLKKYMKRAQLSSIYKIIRKDLKVNGKRAKEETMLSEGDELTFYMDEERLAQLTAPVKKAKVRRQFKVAYEDENVLIVEKPFGLLTHGDAHEKKNTLANQVIGYLQDKGDFNPATEKTFTPSPVNRLDRNTTGLVIFGKTAQALRILTALIRERSTINKYYQTILKGHLKEEMVIDESLSKNEATNTVSVAEVDEETPDAKAALTMVRPMKYGNGYTLAEVLLVTGRTHQIRAHLAHKGYPLIGDTKYGDPRLNKKLGLSTQLLHAYKLEFGKMPEELGELSGKTVTCRLPKAFQDTLDRLEI